MTWDCGKGARLVGCVMRAEIDRMLLVAVCAGLQLGGSLMETSDVELTQHTDEPMLKRIADRRVPKVILCGWILAAMLSVVSIVVGMLYSAACMVPDDGRHTTSSPPAPFVFPRKLSYVVTVECHKFEEYQCPLPSYIGHIITSVTYQDFDSGVIRNDDTIRLNDNDVVDQMVHERVFTFNLNASVMAVRLYMVYESPAIVQCAESLFQGSQVSSSGSMSDDKYLYTEPCPAMSDGAGHDCNVWSVQSPPFFANATMWTLVGNQSVIVRVEDTAGRYSMWFRNWCDHDICVPRQATKVPTSPGSDGLCLVMGPPPQPNSSAITYATSAATRRALALRSHVEARLAART
jgi:hypothetical protein